MLKNNNFTQVRVPKDFVNEIKEEAKKQCRSLSQQVVFWCKLGREAEQINLNKHNKD